MSRSFEEYVAEINRKNPGPQAAGREIEAGQIQTDQLANLMGRPIRALRQKHVQLWIVCARRSRNARIFFASGPMEAVAIEQWLSKLNEDMLSANANDKLCRERADSEDALGSIRVEPFLSGSTFLSSPRFLQVCVGARPLQPPTPQQPDQIPASVVKCLTKHKICVGQDEHRFAVAPVVPAKYAAAAMVECTGNNAVDQPSVTIASELPSAKCEPRHRELPESPLRSNLRRQEDDIRRTTSAPPQLATKPRSIQETDANGVGPGEAFLPNNTTPSPSGNPGSDARSHDGIAQPIRSKRLGTEGSKLSVVQEATMEDGSLISTDNDNCSEDDSRGAQLGNTDEAWSNNNFKDRRGRNPEPHCQRIDGRIVDSAASSLAPTIGTIGRDGKFVVASGPPLIKPAPSRCDRGNAARSSGQRVSEWMPEHLSAQEFDPSRQDGLPVVAIARRFTCASNILSPIGQGFQQEGTSSGVPAGHTSAVFRSETQTEFGSSANAYGSSLTSCKAFEHVKSQTTTRRFFETASQSAGAVRARSRATARRARSASLDFSPSSLAHRRPGKSRSATRKVRVGRHLERRHDFATREAAAALERDSRSGAGGASALAEHTGGSRTTSHSRHGEGTSGASHYRQDHSVSAPRAFGTEGTETERTSSGAASSAGQLQIELSGRRRMHRPVRLKPHRHRHRHRHHSPPRRRERSVHEVGFASPKHGSSSSDAGSTATSSSSTTSGFHFGATNFEASAMSGRGEQFDRFVPVELILPADGLEQHKGAEQASDRASSSSAGTPSRSGGSSPSRRAAWPEDGHQEQEVEAESPQDDGFDLLLNPLFLIRTEGPVWGALMRRAGFVHGLRKLLGLRQLAVVRLGMVN